MAAPIGQNQTIHQLPTEDLWDGEVYKKNATLQQQIGLQVIHSHTNLQDDSVILDVGCGDGFLTHYLAKHFKGSKRVVGIDASNSMLDTAKKGHKDPKVTFQKCNITDPGITSLTPFDVIFSFNTLHWVFEQKSALQNIYKLLVFGGTFRAQLFPPLASQSILIDSIERLKNDDQWKPYLQNFKLPIQMEIHTVEDYRSLLKDVGFHVRQCELSSYAFSQTREQLAMGFKSWLPHLRVIPEGHHDNFLKALADLIFEAKGTGNCNETEMSLFFWIIHAEKH